ncbi:MAG: AMIN domain-containing protein [Gemmatimonadota bacterium]|nr:AMIN domain-containing protein [Gemmatimonadota bacterium]
MMRSLVFAAGLALAASPAHAGPGEVTAVSVLPAPGRAEVVIDVAGSVGYQDFTLDSPSRLVVDITGATLGGTRALYDGVNRAGILNVRYAQYRADVVRIVVELEGLRDYTIEQGEGMIRVAFGSDQSFAAWSSLEPRALAATATGGTMASPYAAPAPPVPALNAPQSQQPRITVTYDSASIADVMAGLAAFSGRSIILGKDVSGVITAEIRNQPWDVAFESILSSQGLSAVEETSGIIRVDNPEILAKRDSLEPLTTKLIRVNYQRAGALVEPLKSVLSTRGKVVADTATNTLIITDVGSRIVDDSVFVSRLDVRTPQVSIHAKLIFVDRTDIENLGVRYDLGTSTQFFNELIQRPDPSTANGVDADGDGNADYVTFESYDPDVTVVDVGGNALSGIANASALIPGSALNLIFSTAIGGYSLTTFVEALQRVELADLQAEPVITTADNTKAKIQVGERVPLRVVDQGAIAGGTGAPRTTTQFEDIGIILEVTPHVTASGQILMQLHAENSSVKEAPADLGYSFATQQADNQILVDDGQTAVIGGLTVTELTVAKSGIPFLVDLPIVGSLFGFTSRRESRRDLLILVTPHIIDTGDEEIAFGGGR